MFNELNEAITAHSDKTIRFTVIKNWNDHIGMRKFITAIGASSFDTVIEHNVSGVKVVEIHSARLDPTKVNELYLRQYNDYSLTNNFPISDWRFETYRNIENLIAPELDLHLEFNHAIKSLHKSGANVVVLVNPTSDNMHDLIEDAMKEDIKYDGLSGSPLEKLSDWTGTKTFWEKSDTLIKIVHPKLISLIYDEGDLDINDRNNLSDHIIYRNDYSIGNEKRVRNWHTPFIKSELKSLDSNLWDFAEWDDLINMLPKVNGEAYPGVVCNYTQETGDREKILREFLDV